MSSNSSNDKNEKKQVSEPVTFDFSDAEVDDAESAGGLPPMVQDDIGRRLRGLYGKLAAEPLPDRFTKLLDQLAKSEKGSIEPEIDK